MAADQPRLADPAAKASGQYLNTVLAKIEADKAGYEEASCSTTTGTSARAPARTSSWSRTQIATPGFTATILDGINRLSAIEIARDLGYEVVERDIARGELYLADEVFMTGTAAEMSPLREIDDHAVGDGRPGPITREVQGVFEDALHGRAERYRSGSTVRCPWRRRQSRAVSRIQLYDTTLRDGMQGEGMSLSAEEKLRLAHRSTSSASPSIEAGFPPRTPRRWSSSTGSRASASHAESARSG